MQLQHGYILNISLVHSESIISFPWLSVKVIDTSDQGLLVLCCKLLQHKRPPQRSKLWSFCWFQDLTDEDIPINWWDMLFIHICIFRYTSDMHWLEPSSMVTGRWAALPFLSHLPVIIEEYYNDKITYIAVYSCVLYNEVFIFYLTLQI